MDRDQNGNKITDGRSPLDGCCGPVDDETGKKKEFHNARLSL
jgi:hypothetical protein